MHRARDLDHLLLGDGQRADEGLRREGGAEALQHAARPLVHGGAVDQAGLSGFAVEVDVLGDRQVRRQSQFLIDDRDACRARLDRPTGLQRFASHQDFAARVRLVGARQDLHQGGFAGAILAHQRVHFAGGDAQGDVGQRFDAGKRLRDVAHLEDRVVRTQACVCAAHGHRFHPEPAPLIGAQALF